MKSGSSASARAIPARWRWPPESSLRVTVDESGRQADKIEQSCGAFAPIAPPFQPSIGGERPRQRDAEPQPRIERGLRILEDHLDARAQGTHTRLIEAADLDAVELDAARGRLKQPDQQAAERGLAGAGFADKAQHRSTRHDKIDAA